MSGRTPMFSTYGAGGKSGVVITYQLGTRSTAIAELHEPTALAIRPDDNLYMSIRGTTAGGGEVIRVPRQP